MEYKIEDTLIVINSSNRLNKTVTHISFPVGVINWVVAVPHDQYKMYKDRFGKDHTYSIPKGVPQFLPSQRQHVMEYFGQVYKYIWLMDDDLTFHKRRDDGKLRVCTRKQVHSMFTEMRRHLETVHMVGISTRLGNNRITTEYDEINRATRCYAMSSKSFKDVGAVFNPFEPFVAEDFHMTLCYLNKGYKNRILHTYAQEDIGSNADGGCSEYRNAEVQRKTSFWMSLNHPEVKVKGKFSKGAWGLQKLKDGRNYRDDVIVSWKLAYKPKKKRAKGGLTSLFKK